MSVHIIIDGYNLIRQSQTLSDFDHQDIEWGRNKLIESLASYKKMRGHKITVVFDGRESTLFNNQREKIKGVWVLFSRKDETADIVIKQLACKEKEKAVVVSSDREIIDYSESQGAATISSPEFETKLALANSGEGHYYMEPEEEDYGWKPTTKKKGPKRRLSKKERKNKKKIRKL